MAVTLVAAAAAQNAGTTTTATTTAITPTTTAVAVSIHPNQRVYVFQSHSCEGGSAATPTDWTALYKDVVVGTGTASAAAGRRFISAYYRDWDGVWSMPSFALVSTAQNSHAIATLTVQCDPTETFDTPTFSGDGEYFGTAGTAFSAATPAAFNAISKAFLMAHSVTNDNVTATSGAITGSGFTSGTVTERADGGTATGNDVTIKLHTCAPTTGANVALTHTMTLSAASQGGWAAVQQTATSTSPTPPTGAFVYDYFRDPDGTVLANHTSDSGHTWTNQSGWGGAETFQNNRVWAPTTDAACMSSVTPPSADYEVSIKFRILSQSAAAQVVVWGRANTADTTGYIAYTYCEASGSNPTVVIARYSPGFGFTNLSGFITSLNPGTFTVGSEHTFTLRMQGTAITAILDGSSTGVTNNVITQVGKAGVGGFDHSATTGSHIESFWANPYPNATDYVKDYTDLVGITDSVTKDAGRVASDAVGVTDSATFSLGYAVSATDLVGVTDSLAKEAGKTATDLVGITDSVSVQQDWVRSQPDAVGVTDSAAFGLDLVATATDLVGITDSASAAQGFDRSATDLVGVTDSITASRGYNSSATDNVGVTDSATFGLGFSPSATDAVGITDSATFSLGASVTATDPVGVTDAVSVQQDWARSQTDLVGITDTAVKDSGRTAADLVGITDSASVEQSRLVSATDPVGLLDSLTIDAGRTATDAVGVTDAVSVQQGWSRTQTDPVGITDSSVLGPGRLATDPIGITDSLSVTQAWVRSDTDLVGVTDSGSFDLAGAGNFTDTDQVGVTDTLDTAFSAVRPLADLVGISDSGLFQVGSVVGAADPVAVSDLLAFTAAYERSWADPVGVADSASFDLSSVGDIVESDLVGIADSADIVAGYARSFTDPVGVVDDAQFLLDTAAAEVVDATDPVGVVDAAFFAIRIPPGPENSWVPRAESVIHTGKAESNRHAGPRELTRFVPKKESNTYAPRAESTHAEVIG